MQRSNIAAIVCTRNRATLLRVALEGLAHQTLSREAYEVIVVDDGSTDTTSQVAASFTSTLRLTYALQRFSGLASAKNHGLFRTNAPIVLFLDDDDRPEPDLLEQHLAAHDRYPAENYAVLGYTGLLPSLELDPLMHFATRVGCFLFSYPTLADGEVLDYTYFWGGRTSCKRSFLIKHGIFNQAFWFGCEDIELGFRLSRNGLRVVYNARAVSRMVRGLTVEDLCDRLVRQGRSNYRFSCLHRDEEVQRWTGVADAEAAWREVASDYDAIVRSARHLDSMTRHRLELGLDLMDSDTRWLEHSYRAACRASIVKGIHEARAGI